MTITELLKHLGEQNTALQFTEVIRCLKQHYQYEPTAFFNGPLYNAAGENEGSCIIFAFAKRHRLSDKQALLCFGEHYQSVLQDPSGTGHGNIRQFMCSGLAGVAFAEEALR